jgi:ABC-2 type transport system permease protein
MCCTARSGNAAATPSRFTSKPIRFALTYILPLAYIATMPAYVLTHGQDFLARCLAGLLLAGGLVGGVWGLWQAGLRRYSSATS